MVCSVLLKLELALQVPLPEKPETDNESVLRKWRWKVKNFKKENVERHSQRCDIELKLAVRISFLTAVKFLLSRFWLLIEYILTESRLPEK